ncbi:MAG: LPS export ABC transporter permease LptF [Candidatus Dadabacteria bacterium]|nr:MAG: LPS export ABC transporter permease LptF [Candidatus Dadabacteria bacterium]
MKILNRYILRETLLYFSISLFAFTGILLTLKMIRFTDLIIQKGVAVSQIVSVFIAIVPTFLEIALPLAALLGVMLAFARLSADSEVIVMRASGISLTQLIRPIALFGTLCFVAGLYISLTLKPWGYRTLAESLFKIARSRTTAGLNQRIFNQLGKLTVYAEEINHKNGDLKNVLIDDRRSKSSSKIILAQSGTVLSDENSRTILFHLKDGEIHELTSQEYALTRFKENVISLESDDLYATSSSKKKQYRGALSQRQLSLQIEKYRLQLKKLEAASDAEDHKHSAKLSYEPRSKKEIKLDLTRLIIERARRFSLPFASLILSLIAMPLGIQPPRTQRTWGAGLPVALGLVVFVAYYVLFTGGVTVAENGALPPVLAVWIPNLAGAVVAAIMLIKMGSEQWEATTQRVAQKINTLLKKFGLG